MTVLAFLGLLGCSSATAPDPGPVAGAYADPAKCAQCHPTIAATYKKTGMGRAFHKVGMDDPATGKPYHHESSDSYFSMIRRDGQLFQRRWQIGHDGKETNVDEKRADYVMGSGNHGQTYLHLTEKGRSEEHTSELQSH